MAGSPVQAPRRLSPSTGANKQWGVCGGSPSPRSAEQGWGCGRGPCAASCHLERHLKEIERELDAQLSFVLSAPCSIPIWLFASDGRDHTECQRTWIGSKGLGLSSLLITGDLGQVVYLGDWQNIQELDGLGENPSPATLLCRLGKVAEPL